MSNKSTSTNLIIFKNFITEAFERGNQVDVVHTDFSKAFDRLDHVLLVEKLSTLGIRDPLLSWLRNYLSDRTQFVSIYDIYSTLIKASSGVPQGSHLGPLLFILFINDLPLYVAHSKLLLFADDAKLYCEVASVRDAIDLQADLSSLNQWCMDNKMDLNADKCYTISFSRKQSTVHYPYSIHHKVLAREDQVKDLGVIFDTKLSFNQHVSVAVKKALRVWDFTLHISLILRRIKFYTMR